MPRIDCLNAEVFLDTYARVTRPGGMYDHVVDAAPAEKAGFDAGIVLSWHASSTDVSEALGR